MHANVDMHLGTFMCMWRFENNPGCHYVLRQTLLQSPELTNSGQSVGQQACPREHISLPRISGSNGACLAFQWVREFKLFLTVNAFSHEPSPQFLLSEFLYSDCYSCAWDPSAFVGIGRIRRKQKGKDKWFLKICNHWLDNGRSARLSASVSIFFLRHKPIYSGRTCGMWKASLHYGLSITEMLTCLPNV